MDSLAEEEEDEEYDDDDDDDDEEEDEEAAMWSSVFDAASEKVYYYHIVTREAVWDKPSALCTARERYVRGSRLSSGGNAAAACDRPKRDAQGSVRPCSVGSSYFCSAHIFSACVCVSPCVTFVRP